MERLVFLFRQGFLFSLLLRQALELGFGLLELRHEFVVVEQGREHQGAHHLSGLDVAVVVEAYNPSALAEVQSALVEEVLPLGVDAGKHHSDGDARGAVTRDVAAVVAKTFLGLGNRRRLVVEGIRTGAHVGVLRAARGIAAGILLHRGDELVDLRRVLLRELHAESLGEDFEDVAGRGVGILDGLLAALGLTERLAVLIHMEVLLEEQGAECGRRTDEGGVVRSFLLRQVVVGLSVADDCSTQKSDDT